MKINLLKKGAILSEVSFFKVVSIESDGIRVVNDNGDQLGIGKEYAETILQSADIFNSEEKKNMTELADLLITSPRIAMTVAFYKKDIVKTKKVYTAEVDAAIKRVQEATVSKVEGLLKDLIENPISKSIPGDLRIMKGRHYGHVDDLGRLHFVDMEQDLVAGKDYDTRIRQIDPRTIQYIVVAGVKYTLK